MASSPNLAEKPAWPEFGPHAAKEGVRSVSCAGMFESEGSGTGAVSVYSREPRGLAAARPDIGLLLASYAATALAGTEAASEEELARFRIQEPLRSFNALERAAHVLIRKRHLTAEDACDVLAGQGWCGARYGRPYDKRVAGSAAVPARREHQDSHLLDQWSERTVLQRYRQETHQQLTSARSVLPIVMRTYGDQVLGPNGESHADYRAGYEDVSGASVPSGPASYGAFGHPTR